jgi:penicillin G amidase
MKWVRRAGWVLAAVVLLAAVAAGGGYLWLRTSLPQTSGTLTLPNLAHRVTIARDADGIVTIKADNEAEAYYALGFAHAQDRLFQMDLMRRLGAGRLSEVIGGATVDTDRLMRLFGFYRLAEGEVGAVPAEMRADLDAYAAGVNAYIDAHAGSLPPEFYLLRYRPEPWRPADSLVWGRLMAFQLSSNWWDELLRYRLARRLTAAQLDELWPLPPGSDMGPPEAQRPKDDRADLAVPPMPALPWLQPSAGASNSFVVDGTLSASGKPLLANDPHLGLQAPIQWYLVRIETPTLRLAGATAPGVPLLIIGHNGHVAWSFTTTQADTQDLFREQTITGDDAHYVTPQGPAAFETREEAIKVRGVDDVRMTIRQTRHGPVVSDLPSVKWEDKTLALALSWAALRTDDLTPAALFRMNRAQNADELMAALADFDSPVQNVVYADTAGHIGFIAAGRVPTRKNLYAAGEMPVPGWMDAYDWTGFIPFPSLPQIAQPSSGWIATANNDIRPVDYFRFIAAKWDLPYRYNRIAELLEATPKHTPDSVAAIQLDTRSEAAAEVVPALLEQLEDGTPLPEPAAAALALLKNWNFRVTRDQPAPLIATAWLAELNDRVLRAKLGDVFETYAQINFITVARLVAGADPSWCTDAPAPRPCAALVHAAFVAAIDKLARAYGDDPNRWRWGDAHRARFTNLVLSQVPLLPLLLPAPIETDGDNYTLNRATPRIDVDTVDYPDVHGAGLRAIFDLADLDRSRFMIAGGQSGNPLSAHYGDLIERWRDGRYLDLRSDGTEVLTLAPETR